MNKTRTPLLILHRLVRGPSAIIAISFVCTFQLAHAETRTYPADGVTRIQFKVPGELLIREGTQEKLVIDAEPKVLQKIDVNVKGDKLTLASKDGFKTDKSLKFTLTIKSFRSLNNEGSGNAVIENFSGNDIDVETAGSGDIRLKNIKAPHLGIAIKGSGNVTAGGSGKKIDARIDGSGRIDAVNFHAQSAQARIGGSGDITVHADKDLTAAISGAGNIEYQGKAKVTQSITGAGSVDRL